RPAAVYAEAEGRGDAGCDRRQHDGCVDEPTAPRASPRLFDQRFEIGDTLREVAAVRCIGRAGRDGDRHMRPPSEEATIASTMIGVKVDRDDPLELHEQVAGEIRRAIADGEAKPGERLPPAKDLAAVLGVNTNTVLRALRELRDEGLLEFRRGRGVTVAAAPERSALVAQATDLVRLARRHGYRVEELVQIIESVAA